MTLNAATVINHDNPCSRRDPSSVGFADTFSPKGRRNLWRPTFKLPDTSPKAPPPDAR
jgi:hypothetical protein